MHGDTQHGASIMQITHHQAYKRLHKIITLVAFSTIAILSSGKSHAVIISDLYITEVMANPAAVTDSNGEWFELFNPTNESFDLNGIILSDNGSNMHIINNPDPLLINSGEYLVLGKNGNELENGGYQTDYMYSGFTLANSDDEIIMTDSQGNQLSLFYDSGFVTAGVSAELLSPDMLTSNYVASTINYGAGDFGSPGSTGTYLFEYDTTSVTTSVPAPPSLWLACIGLSLLLGIQTRKIK